MTAFFSALIISVLATPFVIRFAKTYGLVDDSKKRYHPASVHKGIIPRAGGLAIYISFVLSSLIFFEYSKALVGILIGATIVMVVGLIDDYRDIPPKIRLLTNFLAAGAVVGAGVGTPYIANPLGGAIHLDTVRISFTFLGTHSIIVFSSLFALIWIVWMMNAVGWSAGVDGQFPGFVVIASLVIALLSQRFAAFDISQENVMNLAIITAGAYLGFLFFNFYPQKIMPGYGGKSLAGFLLAILAILSGAKVGTALLVLGVPMMDAFYTMFRRLVKRKSLFKADRGHLHHRLLVLGWGKRRIAIFYWSVTAVLGVIALKFNSPGKFFAFLFVGVLFGVFLLTIRLFNLFRVSR